MKIVINAGFGGFGLSTKAMKLLIKRGCKAVRLTTVDDYTGGRGLFTGGEKTKDAGDGFTVGWIEDVLVKGNIVYTYNRDSRTDPDLIAVVKKMGAAANGECATLEVLEIPDGIEYEIDEYDGMESIHEKHRSWR